MHRNAKTALPHTAICDPSWIFCSRILSHAVTPRFHALPGNKLNTTDRPTTMQPEPSHHYHIYPGFIVAPCYRHFKLYFYLLSLYLILTKSLRHYFLRRASDRLGAPRLKPALRRSTLEAAIPLVITRHRQYPTEPVEQ